MIILSDWHPDIVEFIVSKMQNPDILQYLINNSKDPQIVREAKNKLKLQPLTELEKKAYEALAMNPFVGEEERKEASALVKNGGRLVVEDPDFLTGANISVGITKEFMEAVEKDEMYQLRFPDLDNYTPVQKAVYDAKWQDIGDVRVWEEMGFPVKVYREIRARELWDLISFCATYSAEPGLFFIDNANDMTNAKAYGQSVVGTNPCKHNCMAI